MRYIKFFEEFKGKKSSSWLKSPEGVKWGETIVKYENLVSHILK